MLDRVRSATHGFDVTGSTADLKMYVLEFYLVVLVPSWSSHLVGNLNVRNPRHDLYLRH